VAGHNLVAVFEAGQNFDVGRSGDAGGDRHEARTEPAIVGHEKVDALDHCGLLFCRVRRDRCGRLAVILEELCFDGGVSLDESLDGDREGVGFMCGCNFGGGRETRAERADVSNLIRVEGDDDLEVLGLFGAGCGL
jgi:hypothetical protein